MSDDDWEQIHYHELPDRMKKIAGTEERHPTNRTKIFSGKPFDYKIEYTVTRGIISISYWRRTPAEQPMKYHGPGLLVILFLIVVLVAGTGISWWSHTSGLGGELSNTGPSDDTRESREMNVTAVQPEEGTPLAGENPDTLVLQSPKTTSYPYFMDNTEKFIRFTTYQGLADSFSGKRDFSHSVPEKERVAGLMENPDQKKYLQPLIDAIRDRSVSPDDPARIAVSLVQHIPRAGNTPYTSPPDWFSPYETLYANRGSPSDKSLLLAYLLGELGYDTVVFVYPGRLAAGVRCSPEYDFYDTGYAFIETTRPAIITYVPETYFSGTGVSGSPRRIPVHSGTRVMDVSREYRDAGRWKYLESLGGILDPYQYTERLELSRKYNLQYTV